MSRPVPSLPVAGTDKPPVAMITRSHDSSPFDEVSANPPVNGVRSVTAVSNRISTPFDRANWTSPSRTSLALFDRGNSLPDSSSSASGICNSFSKNARCSCRGQARSMPRSRCAGESVTNRSGASTDGSTLQRPPPLIRILRPPSLVRSIRMTRAPDDAANAAATRPAAPAPITATESTDIHYSLKPCPRTAPLLDSP